MIVKILTLAAVNVDDLVGDTFETVVFVTPSLSDTVVFGLLNVDVRRVDVTGADLTREAVDDTVDVLVFVAVTFDAVVVLVAGLLTVLHKQNKT